MTVERVFGLLKVCWWYLYRKLNMANDNILVVFAMCWILYNICDGKGECFIQAWTAEAQCLEAEFEQREIRAIGSMVRGLKNQGCLEAAI